MMTSSRAIALALVIGAMGLTSQAQAATKHHHRGHGAYARAIDEGGEGQMSAHRASAIRECSGRMNKLVNKDWGVMQDETFASCMTEHGENP